MAYAVGPGFLSTLTIFALYLLLSASGRLSQEGLPLLLSAAQLFIRSKTRSC